MADSRDHTDVEIRVRYAETDRMGFLHHSHYPVYFEQGRTELLRRRGITYREIEDQGFFLVVAKLERKYRNIAAFQGVATGVLGVIGIPADIVGLVTLNQRLVAEVAAYYGFELKSERERLFAVGIRLATQPSS